MTIAGAVGSYKATKAMGAKLANLKAYIPAKVKQKFGVKVAGRKANLQTATKAEVKAVASKTAVVKSEIVAVNQTANDVCQKNVQKNVHEKVENNSAREKWLTAKAKIRGKAQVTGTEGHAIQSKKIAIKAAYEDDVKEVYMNTSLKKITNGQVDSQMKPDVTVVKVDDKIITHEVMSKTQNAPQLNEKIAKMQEMLPESQKAPEGASIVFDVEGKEMK